MATAPHEVLVANHKIKMLAVDAIEVCLPRAAIFCDMDEIAQAHLGEHDMIGN